MSKAAELANLASAFETSLSNRNMIINGDMKISARGTSFTGFGAAVNYSLDRFANYHSSDGAFTISQETSVVPTDFTHALKILTTTADSSIAAGQRLIVFTRCEGNNVSHLNWGTSAAETVTLSFYVRSSITGTHGGAIGNGSDNRNYPFTYTISSADTWERKTITISGDQTGTWATGTGRSLQVVWGLGVGSTYSGSAGAWAAGDINSATGATTGVLGTLNATWYLTGVQLEVGTVATPFEHRSIGKELILTQRYYQTINPKVNAIYGAGYQNNSERISQVCRLGVEMRAEPSCTVHGTWTVSGCDQPAFTSFSTNVISTHILKSGGSAGSAYYHANGTDDFFSMDAEL